MSYLEKATQAARELDRARSMGATDPQEAVVTLSQFEDRLCQALLIETTKVTHVLESTKTASALSPDAARASAALALAADYCEHAAEALDRARQLALDSANRLAKEVPAKVSTWRGELQSKAMLKANPTKASSGYSLLFGSKKALAEAELNKDEDGSPSDEILQSASGEESAQGEKVSPYNKRSILLSSPCTFYLMVSG